MWFRLTRTVRCVSAHLGYLTIRERIKDVIKYNGYQISASELESVVRQVDVVKDVAVVGKIKKDNITRNELPWAFVVVNDDAKNKPEEERTSKILDYVNSRVPPYKKLRGLTWIDAIPTRYVPQSLTQRGWESIET